MANRKFEIEIQEKRIFANWQTVEADTPEEAALIALRDSQSDSNWDNLDLSDPAYMAQVREVDLEDEDRTITEDIPISSEWSSLDEVKEAAQAFLHQHDRAVLEYAMGDGAPVDDRQMWTELHKLEAALRVPALQAQLRAALEQLEQLKKLCSNTDPVHDVLADGWELLRYAVP